MTLSLLSFTDISGAITANGPAVSAATSVPGQTANFVFSGTAGQKVSVTISGATYNPSGGYAWLRLLKPDGTQLASQSISGSTGFWDTNVLPVNGTYILMVDPVGAATASMTLSLLSFTDISDAITANGPAVSVATTVPGQNASYAFAGTAGQKISVTVNGATYNPSGGHAWLRLLKPDGAQLASVTTSGSIGFLDAIVLPVTGTYSLKLDPNGAATISMTLSLLTFTDISDAISVNGPAASVATTVPGQNASYAFAGTAGQSVRVTILSLTGTAYVRLLKPDSGQLTSVYACCGSNSSIPATSLPVTGTYTIMVDPYSNALTTTSLILTSP